MFHEYIYMNSTGWDEISPIFLAQDTADSSRDFVKTLMYFRFPKMVGIT